MVMQTKRKQLNRIFASWVLAGFWFLALIGMSVLSDPYRTSATDTFAADSASEKTIVLLVANTAPQDGANI